MAEGDEAREQRRLAREARREEEERARGGEGDGGAAQGGEGDQAGGDDDGNLDEQMSVKDMRKMMKTMMKTMQAQAAAMQAQAEHRGLGESSTRVKPRGRVFEGKKDTLATWIFGTEQDFEALNRVNDHDKMVYAVTLLEGAALQWFQNLVQLGMRPVTWEAFKTAAEGQFCAEDEQVRLRDELAALRQTGTVQKYCDDFMHVFLRVRNMDECTAKQLFCLGLNARLRAEVRIRKPAVLQDAIRLAQSFQDVFSDVEPMRKQYSGQAAAAATFQRPQETRAVGAMRQGTAAAAGASATKADLHATAVLPRPPKLTATEKERLMRIGGCFKCREPGHIAAACPLPWPKRAAFKELVAEEVKSQPEDFLRRS